MLLTIDNADGRGAQDYTASLDAEHLPTIERALNRPSRMKAALLATSPDLVIPANRARIVLERADGTRLFTGYLDGSPDYEYLGWNERGPVYRYRLTAVSDEVLLDRKLLHERAPFLRRSAGDILRQLAADLLPGAFDTAAVEAGDTVPSYTSDVRRKFSDHAASLATLARCAYRAHDARLYFSGVGKNSYLLDETSSDFCPEGLTLHSPDRLVNDITVTGRSEPGAYVKDYFLGDGYTLSFPLSQSPWARWNKVLVEDEFGGSGLDLQYWTSADPAHAISVNGGKLRINGGTGADGTTALSLVESIELGGTLVLQHGEVEFTGASTGILGGIYNGAIDLAHCVAGFRITPSGAQSVITPVINGANAGSTITTQANHRYLLTTRVFASQPYRFAQTFHSSQNQAGAGIGGTTIAADARFVLEVHDVDAANAGSQAAAATILYDGSIANVPAAALYALVNSSNLKATVSFTRLLRGANVEISSTLPSQSPRTKLLGSTHEGAQCYLDDPPALNFYSQYVPAPQESIRASYRAAQDAIARVQDTASIAANTRAGDDGVRCDARHVLTPAPRTNAECESAALALLNDTTRAAWTGEYRTWSDFLPQRATDIFPGDALAVTAPSRGANFSAIVRAVDIEISGGTGDRARYSIRFANDAAAALGFETDTAQVADSGVPVQTTGNIGASYIADLTSAEVTGVSSITVTVNTGVAPPAGGGFEVRRSDYGWGTDTDRNLVGRFTAQTFTLARLSRSQTYYLRQYDAASPPRYSRYSTVLHVSYPL